MAMKRPSSSVGEPVSPPAAKRKIESTTTNKAVASFFKPASEKGSGPEKLTWRLIDNSLIIGKYNLSSSDVRSTPRKIAAFDLDGTIIGPATSNKWAKGADAWKWWDATVPVRLKQLHEDGYLVVILTNQGAISLREKKPQALQKDSLSLLNFKSQMASILPQLDFPISVYAASTQDKYRKPRVGMWQEMLEDYDLDVSGAIDMENSFFVGDAAGREKTDTRPKDFSSSDRDLASNLGITFKTPEEFFKSEPLAPRLPIFEPKFYLADDSEGKGDLETFTKNNSQDLVIFCGSPGAGKSTFYWEKLQPLGYERVNQDTLKTRDRCLKMAKDYLTAGRSVAVDNTNANVETRAYWIKLAQEFQIPIRCILFTAPARLCEHNDAVRAFNPELMNPEGRTILPGIAFKSYVNRFTPPKVTEEFQDIVEVDFRFNGSAEQRKVWCQYWISKFST